MMTGNVQAVLLLCSRLALRDDRDDARPLTPREWTKLAAQLRKAGGAKPEDLLGLTAEALESRFELTGDEAERLAKLLGRDGEMSQELERLESLGIWVLSCVDNDYPQRWLERLDQSAPPLLFGCGPRRLLNKGGLAVVGSRDAIKVAEDAARFAGASAAASGMVLVSGGARGIDQVAMSGALAAEGQAVGILADSLERTLRGSEVRQHLGQDNLVLATPYSPNAGFSVGNAMGRNKLIYTLADYALVVSSDTEKGGTWAGATEAIQRKWIPVFACAGDDFPAGNRQLIKKGAQPFPWSSEHNPGSLLDWLQSSAQPTAQPTLF